MFLIPVFSPIRVGPIPALRIGYSIPNISHSFVLSIFFPISLPLLLLCQQKVILSHVHRLHHSSHGNGSKEVQVNTRSRSGNDPLILDPGEVLDQVFPLFDIILGGNGDLLHDGGTTSVIVPDLGNTSGGGAEHVAHVTPQLRLILR